MDNLFQILAVIFIVYSILSPLFNAGKDKKNRPQSGNGKPGPLSSGPIITGDKRSGTSAGSADANGVLRSERTKYQGEISRSQYPRGGRPGEISVPSGTYDDKQSYDAGKQYTEGRIDYDEIASYDQSSAAKPGRRTASSSKVKQTEVKTQPPPQELNLHMIDVRRMLQNPATLQEIILLSEIVSKPRAYHRKTGL